MDNIIPMITDPRGSGWKQPQLKNILVDDTHAVMAKKDFDKLLEYSCSFPSGIYRGKMWKSNSQRTGKWYLRWFGECEKPDHVSNNMREIIVV